MKKALIFHSSIIIFLFTSCLSSNYKIRSVKHGKNEEKVAEVVIPPKGKVAHKLFRKDAYKCNTWKKYQSVLFCDLETNYIQAVENVQNAKHRRYGNPVKRAPLIWSGYRYAVLVKPWGQIIFYINPIHKKTRKNTRVNFDNVQNDTINVASPFTITKAQIGNQLGLDDYFCST